MKSHIIFGISLACLLFLVGFMLLSDQSEARPAPTASGTLQPIVMWSGTLADIPAGWQLCDGTNGTPDLRDRFVLGTQTGEVPGETSGAHEVQLSSANLPSHRHAFQTEIGGLHDHSFEDKYYTLYFQILDGGPIPAYHAGYNYTGINRTSTSSGDHTHTGNTDYEGNAESFDNRPASYRLAFITRLQGKSRSSFGITRGMIIVWSGDATTIPAGWQLCDGTNGTPDLCNRFVVGVQDGQDPGEMTGTDSIELSAANLPEHYHPFQTATAGNHSHGYWDTWLDSWGCWSGGPVPNEWTWEGDAWENETTSPGGMHSHTGMTDYEGTGASIDNRPSYYTFAFIIKTAGKSSSRAQQSAINVQHVERHLFPIPTESIVLWSGDETTIPHGWLFCDGSNGTPDLRDRFIRGGETPGETGGSDAIQITLGTMPQHRHTFTTDLGGEHTHVVEDHFRMLTTYWILGGSATYPGANPLYEVSNALDDAGDHFHTGDTEYSGLTSPVPYDNRPAHLKLAFIKKVL